MTALSLTLLGGFQVRFGTDPVGPVAVKKAKALLAYLALQPDQPYTRDKLAALLWEESPESQARQSLRQALASLRKEIPHADRALVADTDTLTIASDYVDVDVRRFEKLAAQTNPEALEQAVTLYQGDLLEGFNAKAPAFEEWLMVERSRLRERAAQLMTALIDHYQTMDAVERAIQLGIRLLALDPLRESAHRMLMDLYARQGRYGSALRQYRVCRGILRRELDVGPEEKTDLVYHAIVARRREPAQPEDAVAVDVRPQAQEPAEDFAKKLVADLSTEARKPTTERRQVTVVCVRLVEFEATTARLAADEIPALLDRFYDLTSEAIELYGGSVINCSGETVLSAFGVALAHDNDAERALRAAEHIYQSVGNAGGDGKPPLAVQVGIASGQALVSHHLGKYSVIGAAADQATRLAAHAKAGDTLVADAVYRSVRAPLSAVPSKDTPPTWRMRSLGPPAQTTRQLHFIGRGRECRQFVSALEACLEYESGQSFLIRGEAGIGKTRLVQEFRALAADRGFRCHIGWVLDFGTATGHDAVRTLVRDMLELTPAGEGADTAIEEALGHESIEPDRRMFLNDLLEAPQPAALQGVFSAMDNAARLQGKKALLAWLTATLSKRRPTLLVVEDIHWADDMTLDFLAAVAERVSDCRALLLMTSRVEGEPLDPRWRGAMHGAPLTTIDLGPLRDNEALALAEQIAGADSDFARRCVERAGGIPLFLEQLLRAGRAQQEAVPDSIQSIVWAQLDRLAVSDKQAVQAAAVLGQRFTLDTLRYLIDDREYACEPLIKQHLVRPVGESYMFTHALILEGIYASMLASTRQAAHRRAADYFRDCDPILYAEHLDRAEDPQAPTAYLAAARAQAQMYHYGRARHLIEQGLRLGSNTEIDFDLTCARADLLRESGAIDDSLDAFEHALRVADNPHKRCRAWTGRAAGLRIKDRYTEALEALDHAERTRAAGAKELAQIHYYRGSVLFPLGQTDDCLKAQQRALEFARKADSPLFKAYALSGLGDAYYQRGRIITAHRHFDQCITLCRVHGFGRIEVETLSMRGLTSFYQNKLDAALEDNNAAAHMAARVSHHRAEALARLILGYTLHYAGDWSAAKAQAEQSVALTRKLGARRFEAIALCYLGNALANLGSNAEAEKLMQDACSLSLEVGITSSGPWMLSILALNSDDPEKRRWALGKGEEILRQDCISHNYLHFYQNAIEVALATDNWEEAERYASLLEDYTRPEPLPWSEFFVARGRALAAYGRGNRGPATMGALRRLRDEAERVGLNVALPALRAALAAPS